MESSKNKREWIGNLIEYIVYLVVLIPLVFISISVVWQSIREPNKIPDILGYKMFIILQEHMDDSVKEGDIVITKNRKANQLEIGDVIAFRNEMDTVTIHKIMEEKEEDKTHIFVMNALEGETNDTRYVRDNKVEGKMIHRIPKIGKVIYFIQQPAVMITILIMIAIVGLICIYIAGKLDERELRENT